MTSLRRNDMSKNHLGDMSKKSLDLDATYVVIKDLEERDAWQKNELDRLTRALAAPSGSGVSPQSVNGPRDLSNEEWREFIYRDQPPVVMPPGSGPIPGYPAQVASNVRIMSPVRLYVGKTTHRVVNGEGYVFIVPAPGYFGCFIR